MLRWVGWLVWCALPLSAADKPPEVKTVCELIESSQSLDHENVLVLGRISKHGDERWIEEDACPQAGGSKLLAVRFDRQTGPLPSGDFALPAELLKTKFRTVEAHTALHEFKFGSGDFEQWGIVFGRVEMGAGQSARASGTVVCRSEALVFLWDSQAH